MVDSGTAHPVGGVRVLLRLEGLALLIGASLAYASFGSGWAVFAWCFLLPDLAFIAYLAGPRWGALAYNTTHSTLGGLTALAWGVLAGASLGVTVGLIWLAHIGFDRALGYGLKYQSGFGFTHLGRIGRQSSGS